MRYVKPGPFHDPHCERWGVYRGLGLKAGVCDSHTLLDNKDPEFLHPGWPDGLNLLSFISGIKMSYIIKYAQFLLSYCIQESP